MTGTDEQCSDQFISLQFIQCIAHFIEKELVDHIGPSIRSLQGPGNGPVAMVGDLDSLVGEHQPGTGGTDWMTQGNGSSIYIDDLLVHFPEYFFEAEFFVTKFFRFACIHHCEGLSGKGLI